MTRSVRDPDRTDPHPTALLSGITVLSIEQFGAAPFATMILSDLGANVIKVEHPDGGDVGRQVGPFAESNDSLYFQSLNRGKQSITLDLKLPRHRQVFLSLVASADVVLHNLRGGVAEDLGLGFSDLKRVNPEIVLLAMTGFGTGGSRESDPAYDYLIQGAAGWMDLNRENGHGPVKTGLSLVDWTTGIMAAGATLAGVLSARRTGVGVNLEVSLMDVAVGLLNYPATWLMTADYEAPHQSQSAHPSIVPFQNFETADGWIVVGAAKDAFWLRLVGVLDSDHLRDARFDTLAGRFTHKAEVVARLKSIFRTDTSSGWLERLRAGGVPSGPVRTLRGALASEDVVGPGLIAEFDHPVWGVVKTPAPMVRVDGVRAPVSVAPTLGGDTVRILVEFLGMSRGQAEQCAAELSGRQT